MGREACPGDPQGVCHSPQPDRRQEEHEVVGEPIFEGAPIGQVEKGNESESNCEHDSQEGRASNDGYWFHDAFQIASDCDIVTVSLVKCK